MLAGYINLLATDTATVIDQSLVDSLVTLVESCMGLFSKFPINIILIGGLCGVAFKLIRGAKKAAK